MLVKKIGLIAVIAVLLTGCAQTTFNAGLKENEDCAKTYLTYLNYPYCTETVIEDCKTIQDMIAVQALSDTVQATKAAANIARKNDTLTSEIVDAYIVSEEAYCEKVNTLGVK